MTSILPEVRPAPSKPKEVEILEHAAEIIEEYGWCQGGYASTGNRLATIGEEGIRSSRWTSYCSLGAIWRAAADLGYAPSSYLDINPTANMPGGIFIHYIAAHAGLDGTQCNRLLAWNDMTCENAQEAAAHLRRLAEETRAAGVTGSTSASNPDGESSSLSRPSTPKKGDWW